MLAKLGKFDRISIEKSGRVTPISIHTKIPCCFNVSERLSGCYFEFKIKLGS